MDHTEPSPTTSWVFSYSSGRWTRTIGEYSASVWPRVSGKRWIGSVGNGHRSATGQGFTSPEEAQAWCEQYALRFAAEDHEYASPETLDQA